MTNSNDKNETKYHSKKRIQIASAIATGILVLGVLPMTTLIPQAYGVNCCYATHNLLQNLTPNMYGVRAVYKVIDTTISSGALHAPTWATLGAGSFREVGWADNSAGQFHTYYAIDGVKQLPVYTGITNNTQYTFQVSNTNQDFVWDMITVGIAQSANGPSQKATPIQTGYEPSQTSITPPKLHFNSQSVYENGVWSLWASGLGLKSKTIEPKPEIYYVRECGGTAEQWYHTMHGKLPDPGTCT